PEDFGLRRQPADSVPGGDPQENARIARAIFAGEPGAALDLAVLNAGAAIYAGARAETLVEGVERAQQAIDSGAAAAKLEEFVSRTRALAPEDPQV
ncbi:MAG: anthranilate phosphoribosyltransferase, partial [Solirubrobacteraceae bacterium]